MGRWGKLIGLVLLAFNAASFAEPPISLVGAGIKGSGGESPLNGSIDIQYAPTHFPRFEWMPGLTRDANVHGLRIAASWIPVSGDAGKLGFGLDFGYYFTSRVELTAGKSANLEVFPIGLNINYHFDYMKNQIIVPFAKIGPEVMFANQSFIADTDPSTTRTFYGLNYSLGLELCLNVIDPGSARDLDNSTGINGIYLVAEHAWTDFVAELGTPDLTRSEWLLGLRAEF